MAKKVTVNPSTGWIGGSTKPKPGGSKTPGPKPKKSTGGNAKNRRPPGTN